MDTALTTTLEGDVIAPLDTLGRWEAVQTILTQTVPPSVVKTRPGRGGKSFSYVPHNWVTKTLNDAFGFDWDGEVLPDTLSVTELGVLLFYRLTVRIGEHVITKTEPGWKENITNNRGESAMTLGDQVKSAASDGLRRCAMRLGLGLNLYGSDEEPTQAEVKTMLASYAERHLGWDARQTFDWLKEQGYTASDLMPKRDAMYRALADQAGKTGTQENFDAPDEASEAPDIDYGGELLGVSLGQPAERPPAKLEGVGKDPAGLIAQGKQAMAQQPTAPDKPHWIKDRNVQKRFWRWAGQDLGLSNDEVHKALGYPHVEEFDGTMDEAKDFIEVYVQARSEDAHWVRTEKGAHIWFGGIDKRGMRAVDARLALGVEDIRDYQGTLGEALAILDA